MDNDKILIVVEMTVELENTPAGMDRIGPVLEYLRMFFANEELGRGVKCVGAVAVEIPGKEIENG